jgi:hypothetical protein
MACDVVACGPLRPAVGGSPLDPLNPLSPGAQIQVAGADPGTLGGFAQDASGAVYLVSNCHVLSPDLATEGASVFQPAIGSPGSRRIATVAQVIPIHSDGRNRLDIGLARLDPGIDFDPSIPTIGRILGTGIPAKAVPVFKYGQATLDTDGRLDSADADIVVDYPFLSASFSDVYSFRPSGFADDGDSGSAVVDNAGLLVGFIFATSILLNFVIPVQAITDCPDFVGLTWM